MRILETEEAIIKIFSKQRTTFYNSAYKQRRAILSPSSGYSLFCRRVVLKLFSPDISKEFFNIYNSLINQRKFFGGNAAYIDKYHDNIIFEYNYTEKCKRNIFGFVKFRNEGKFSSLVLNIIIISVTINYGIDKTSSDNKITKKSKYSLLNLMTFNLNSTEKKFTPKLLVIICGSIPDGSDVKCNKSKKYTSEFLSDRLKSSENWRLLSSDIITPIFNRYKNLCIKQFQLYLNSDKNNAHVKIHFYHNHRKLIYVTPVTKTKFIVQRYYILVCNLSFQKEYNINLTKYFRCNGLFRNKIKTWQIKKLLILQKNFIAVSRSRNSAALSASNITETHYFFFIITLIKYVKDAKTPFSAAEKFFLYKIKQEKYVLNYGTLNFMNTCFKIFFKSNILKIKEIIFDCFKNKYGNYSVIIFHYRIIIKSFPIVNPNNSSGDSYSIKTAPPSTNNRSLERSKSNSKRSHHSREKLSSHDKNKGGRNKFNSKRSHNSRENLSSNDKDKGGRSKSNSKRLHHSREKLSSNDKDKGSRNKSNSKRSRNSREKLSSNDKDKGGNEIKRTQYQNNTRIRLRDESTGRRVSYNINGKNQVINNNKNKPEKISAKLDHKLKTLNSDDDKSKEKNHMKTEKVRKKELLFIQYQDRSFKDNQPPKSEVTISQPNPALDVSPTGSMLSGVNISPTPSENMELIEHEQVKPILDTHLPTRTEQPNKFDQPIKTDQKEQVGLSEKPIEKHKLQKDQQKPKSKTGKIPICTCNGSSQFQPSESEDVLVYIDSEGNPWVESQPSGNESNFGYTDSEGNLRVPLQVPIVSNSNFCNCGIRSDNGNSKIGGSADNGGVGGGGGYEDCDSNSKSYHYSDWCGTSDGRSKRNFFNRFILCGRCCRYGGGITKKNDDNVKGGSVVGGSDSGQSADRGIGYTGVGVNRPSYERMPPVSVGGIRAITASSCLFSCTKKKTERTMVTKGRFRIEADMDTRRLNVCVDKNIRNNLIYLLSRLADEWEKRMQKNN